MTTKTIAITGATGQFGAIALDLLKAKQANVLALVRSPEKILGVEARKFDYSKTEGQVEALQGVDTLILVSSNEIGQCCRSRILRNVTAKSENFKISQVSHF